MILRTYSFTLHPVNPDTVQNNTLRAYFEKALSTYLIFHENDIGPLIHRYPVIQLKIIDDMQMVIGINEGASALLEICSGNTEIQVNDTTYRISGNGRSLKIEEFGHSEKMRSYEFVTPWLALTQENYRKFYTLKGKEQRDTFMGTVLTGNLRSLARSVGYDSPLEITGETQVKFRKDRIENIPDMVFTGKFSVNFSIPDYLGIGKSVSRGFGTVRQALQSRSPTGTGPSGKF
ncbi:MAG: CRISPR-associated endonuclease Cas6 [Methanoregulaceae archaeon]